MWRVVLAKKGRWIPKNCGHEALQPVHHGKATSRKGLSQTSASRSLLKHYIKNEQSLTLIWLRIVWKSALEIAKNSGQSAMKFRGFEYLSFHHFHPPPPPSITRPTWPRYLHSTVKGKAHSNSTGLTNSSGTDTSDTNRVWPLEFNGPWRSLKVCIIR